MSCSLYVCIEWLELRNKNDLLSTVGHFGVQPSVHNMAVFLACVCEVRF